MQRRDFISWATSSATLAALGLGRFGDLGAGTAAAQTAGSFIFELDGRVAGKLRSFSGADAYGSTTASASACGAPKSTGAVRFTDLNLQLDPVADPAIHAWINTMLSCRPAPYTMAITVLDANFRPSRRLEITNGTLLQAKLPVFDGTAGAAGPPLELVIRPQQARWLAGTGAAGSLGVKSKIAGGFSLTVAGLPSASVSRVEALAFEQRFTAAGGFGAVDISNLVANVGLAQAEGWRTWFNDYLVNGKRTDERTGSLQLLAPDLKSVIWTLQLFGLGPVTMSSGYGSANTASAQSRVELYVERAAFA